MIQIKTYALYLFKCTGYRAEQYACTFPAMINDWREKWYQGTAGQTNPMFPFGFVQVMYFPLIKPTH